MGLWGCAIYIYICIYIYMCICTNIIYMYTFLYLCVYVYIYIYNMKQKELAIHAPIPTLSAFQSELRISTCERETRSRSATQSSCRAMAASIRYQAHGSIQKL